MSCIQLSSSLFVNDDATSELYTLSLHDALPILVVSLWVGAGGGQPSDTSLGALAAGEAALWLGLLGAPILRSEEHTSELQSLTNLVCRLLLEKKNKTEHRRQGIYNNKPASL